MPLTKSVLERMRKKTLEAIRKATDPQEIADLKEELSSIEEQLQSTNDEESSSQGMSDELSLRCTTPPLRPPPSLPARTSTESTKSSASVVPALTLRNLQQLELSHQSTESQRQLSPPLSVRSSSSRSSARSIRSAALKARRQQVEDDLESCSSFCSETTSQLDEEERQIQLLNQQVEKQQLENQRIANLLKEAESKRQLEERLLKYNKEEAVSKAKKLEQEEKLAKDVQLKKEEERRRNNLLQEQIREAELKMKRDKEQLEEYQLKSAQERARLERQKVEQERLLKMRQEQFRQSDEYMQQFTRECPSCGSAIYKYSGCENVTCPCGYKFNYNNARPGRARNFENMVLNNVNFSLVIQLVNGKQHVVTFNSVRPTVDELYTKAAVLSGSDVEVVFGGRTLAKGSFLDSYGISNNSVVFCTYRVPGGVEENEQNTMPVKADSRSRNAAKKARRDAQRQQLAKLKETLQTVQKENEEYEKELKGYLPVLHESEFGLCYFLEQFEDKNRNCLSMEEQKYRSKLEYHSLKNQNKIFADNKFNLNSLTSYERRSISHYQQTPVVTKKSSVKAMDCYKTSISATYRNSRKPIARTGIVDWAKHTLQKIWAFTGLGNLYWVCSYFKSYEEQEDQHQLNKDITQDSSVLTETFVQPNIVELIQEPSIMDSMKIFGLPNHGNTCYQNAALQALLHCQGVVRYMNEPNAANGTISKAFYDIVINYHLNQSNGISSCLRSLRKRLGSSYYNDGSQQDGYQFMSDIISAMERENSLVIREFLGELEVEQYCSHCNYSQFTTQTFISVTLPIPQYGQPTLDSCFDILFEYCEKECDMCHHSCRISKRFKHLPPVVILHLNRFKCGQREIIKNQIPLSNIPLELRGPLNGYHLESVVRHSGSTHGGHYYTESLVNGQWHIFNDSMSYLTSPPVPNGTEYILVYSNYGSK